MSIRFGWEMSVGEWSFEFDGFGSFEASYGLFLARLEDAVALDA